MWSMNNMLLKNQWFTNKNQGGHLKKQLKTNENVNTSKLWHAAKSFCSCQQYKPSSGNKKNLKCTTYLYLKELEKEISIRKEILRIRTEIYEKKTKIIEKIMETKVPSKDKQS